MRVKVDEGEWRWGSMKMKVYEGEGRWMKVNEANECAWETKAGWWGLGDTDRVFSNRKNPKLKWLCFGNDLIAKAMFFVRKGIVTLETKEVFSAVLVRERRSCRQKKHQTATLHDTYQIKEDHVSWGRFTQSWYHTRQHNYTQRRNDNNFSFNPPNGPRWIYVTLLP